MGENLDLEGRLATRSTMQWNDGPLGGFGPADGAPSRRRPPEGRFGPSHVNVAVQRNDPQSLFRWVSHAVRTRRQIPELGAGAWSVLSTSEDAVLAHRCEIDGSSFVAVHNLTDGERCAEVEVEECLALCEVLASPGTTVERAGQEQLVVRLPRFGHLWLRTDDPLSMCDAGQQQGRAESS